MMMLMVMMVITPMSFAIIKSQFYKYILIFIKNNLCLEYTNDNYNNIDEDDDDVVSIVSIYYMT